MRIAREGCGMRYMFLPLIFLLMPYSAGLTETDFGTNNQEHRINNT